MRLHLPTVCAMLSSIIISTGKKLGGCKICACHHDNKFGGVLVECSDRQLREVPIDLPERTTTLHLDGNEFNKLNERAFVALKNLKRLDVSKNYLRNIDENAFFGLSNLDELNLEWNKLTLNDWTYNQLLFKPLANLRSLKLNNNSNPMYLPANASYPDSSFQHLLSLQELFIDGLPGAFGPGFRKLVHLKNLTLSGSYGYCTIPVFKNSTFENVPHVEMLNVSNCLTFDTEPMTFSSLQNITTLDISLNHRLGFTNLSKSLFGLQSSPIQILKINRVYPFYGSCTRIRLHCTALRELHIDGNGIIGADQEALNYFPSSLEVVFARENRFAFGVYLFELRNMESLRFLDITYLNAWRTSLTRPIHSDLVNSKSISPSVFPPKLETIIISNCYVSGEIFSNVVQKNAVKTIIADHNLFTSIKGPLYGFEGLESVDLSHNVLSFISKNLFSNFLSMKYLDLSHNNLGDCFQKDERGEIFQGLTKLMHLNINANKINFLSRDMFRDLYMIKTLFIADNELDNLDASFEHMKHLTYLDLGNNKLQSVRLWYIYNLENVTLNLKGNSLSCTCINYHTLELILRERSKIKDFQTTQCIKSTGMPANLTELKSIVMDLEKQCQPFIAIFASILSGLILVLIVICFCIAYRYRWKLRRLYYVGKRREQKETEEDHVFYRYHAFVSYSEDERDFVRNSMIPELEQKVGLRLCIHDRDFIPGTVIASNIANAIQNSRKTLIILSPSFLKSDWCQFEYNMARTEGVSRRENVVIAVLYRPVDVNDMPKDMAFLFAQYSYLQYNENGHETFSGKTSLTP